MPKAKQTLKRPKIQRTYVTATDCLTKKSKSLTVYGATPASVIKTIEGAIAESATAATTAP